MRDHGLGINGARFMGCLVIGQDHDFGIGLEAGGGHDIYVRAKRAVAKTRTKAQAAAPAPGGIGVRERRHICLGLGVTAVEQEMAGAGRKGDLGGAQQQKIFDLFARGGGLPVKVTRQRFWASWRSV